MSTERDLVSELRATGVLSEPIPPCEADPDDDLLRCNACGAVEGAEEPIMFDMLSGEYRCERDFPWDATDDGEVPLRDK